MSLSKLFKDHILPWLAVAVLGGGVVLLILLGRQQPHDHCGSLPAAQQVDCESALHDAP